MKKIKGFWKSFKRGFKTILKNGTLAKILVIVSSLALLATSVLPYILR